MNSNEISFLKLGESIEDFKMTAKTMLGEANSIQTICDSILPNLTKLENKYNNAFIGEYIQTYGDTTYKYKVSWNIENIEDWKRSNDIKNDAQELSSNLENLISFIDKVDLIKEKLELLE